MLSELRTSRGSVKPIVGRPSAWCRDSGSRRHPAKANVPRNYLVFPIMLINICIRSEYRLVVLFEYYDALRPCHASRLVTDPVRFLTTFSSPPLLQPHPASLFRPLHTQRLHNQQSYTQQHDRPPPLLLLPRHSDLYYPPIQLVSKLDLPSHTWPPWCFTRSIVPIRIAHTSQTCPSHAYTGSL